MRKVAIPVCIWTKQLVTISLLLDSYVSIFKLRLVEGVDDSNFGGDVTVRLGCFVVGILLAIQRVVPAFAATHDDFDGLVLMLAVIVTIVESLFA